MPPPFLDVEVVLMVIGVTSTSLRGQQLIVNLFQKDWNFQVLTESELIKIIGVGNLINNLQMKKSILEELSITNIVISSNVFFDANMFLFLTKTNGMLLVIKDTENINPFFIDVFMEKWKDIPCVIWDYDEVPQSFNTLESKIEVKQVEKVNIEDTIQKAMKKLGLDDPDLELDESSDTLIVVPNPNITSDVSKPTIEIPNDVFLKLRDGTIALLFPQNILEHLPVSKVNGQDMVQLTFRAPDLGNLNLQQLSILNVEDSEPTPPMEVTPTNLLELVQEKSKIDQAIKEARATGQDQQVKELRRQRHVLRNKINKFGQ